MFYQLHYNYKLSKNKINLFIKIVSLLSVIINIIIIIKNHFEDLFIEDKEIFSQYLTSSYL